jgi:hypothetical protein
MFDGWMNTGNLPDWVVDSQHFLTASFGQSIQLEIEFAASTICHICYHKSPVTRA